MGSVCSFCGTANGIFHTLQFSLLHLFRAAKDQLLGSWRSQKPGVILGRSLSSDAWSLMVNERASSFLTSPFLGNYCWLPALLRYRTRHLFGLPVLKRTFFLVWQPGSRVMVRPLMAENYSCDDICRLPLPACVLKSAFYCCHSRSGAPDAGLLGGRVGT